MLARRRVQWMIVQRNEGGWLAESGAHRWEESREVLFNWILNCYWPPGQSCRKLLTPACPVLLCELYQAIRYGVPVPVDRWSELCLSVDCEGYAHFLSDEAINALLACRKAIPSSNNPALWLDILPWDLAIDALRSNPGRTEKQLEFNYSGKYWALAPSGMSMSPVNFLVENLTHHNSSIRSLILELTWFVRKRIPLKKRRGHSWRMRRIR